MDDITGASTGADTQSVNADSQGATTQAGADTQAANADLQGQQSTDSTASTEADTTGQEPQSGTEGKQPHQTTEAERFEQLRRERDEDRRKLAELEAKITAPPPKPEYFGADVETNVKLNIARASAKIAEIQTQANIDPQGLTPEMADELIKLQDWVSDARAALKDNTAKRTAAQKAQEEAAQKADADTKAQAEHVEKMENAVKLIAESEKLPADLVGKMREFVAQELNNDKLFQAEAVEVLERRGYVAHVKFCLEHARAKMGKAAEAAQQQKEIAKEQHPGGVTASNSTDKTAIADDLPLSEWMKRRNKQLN